jgi:PadR family transcriptional regulator PadR
MVPRLTGTVIEVFAALLRAGDDGAYGREIADAAGLSKTTIYDVLIRLEHAGWALSEWENVDPRTEKRPRRRVYRLSASGRETASRAVEARVAALTGRDTKSDPARRPGHALS